MQQWIRDLMCDPLYLLGDTKMIPICISISCFSMSIIIAFHSSKDMNQKLYFFDYYYLFINNRLRYSLDITNDFSWFKYINVLGKLWIDIIIPFYIICSIILILILSILSYNDLDSNYSLLMTIIYLIIFCLTLIECLLNIWFYLGFSLIVFIGKGLKFNEIANKIKICVEQNKRDFIRYNLIDFIEEHNYFTKITADINKTFRVFILFLYYLIIPIVSMAIYTIHHKKTEITAKILAFVISLVGLFFLLFISRILNWIINVAHKPKIYLEHYLYKNANRIPIKTQMKVQTYIERLSGPDIGFWCYDLFPINSYEFYKITAISVCNYFLLMEFF